MRGQRLLIVLLLAGCSQPPAEKPRTPPGPTLQLSQEPRRPNWNWGKAGATSEEFARDQAACHAYASSVAETAKGQAVARLNGCMESKGYQRVPAQ